MDVIWCVLNIQEVSNDARVAKGNQSHVFSV